MLLSTRSSTDVHLIGNVRILVDDPKINSHLVIPPGIVETRCVPGPEHPSLRRLSALSHLSSSPPFVEVFVVVRIPLVSVFDSIVNANAPLANDDRPIATAVVRAGMLDVGIFGLGDSGILDVTVVIVSGKCQVGQELFWSPEPQFWSIIWIGTRLSVLT